MASEKCGLSDRSHIAHLLRSKGKPQLHTIAALSQGFQVPPEFWTSEEPREYLAIWLRWLPDERVSEIRRLPPHLRLQRLQTELERVWPDVRFLDNLVLTNPDDLASFARGERPLEATQRQEICTSLGLPADFLEEETQFDPWEQHQFEHIIALAKSFGLTPKDLLQVVSEHIMKKQ